MITTIQELKDLIEFAKSQKLKRLSLNGLEVEFSDLSFVEAPVELDLKTMLSNSSTLTDTDKSVPISEDEDLYWSTGA